MQLQRPKKPAILALASLALLAPLIAGCEYFPKSQINAAAVLSDVPVVNARPENSCAQKREIAAQRSYIESATTGKDVVYAPKCSTPAKAS